jgi:outer membrane lipoprotein-sorting protein
MSLFTRTVPVLLFSFCASAQLQPVFQKMDEAAAKFRGLTADVVRKHYTAVVQETETSKGTLTVKREKGKDFKALFRIVEPDPQQIAYSGRKARVYNPKINVIDEYELDKKLGSKVNDYLLLGFGASSKDLQQSYNISFGGDETIDGRKTTKLVLIPKKADAGAELTKAELWISNETGMAVQQKFYSQGGDYDLVTYSNMNINPAIPNSAVELNAPSNAKTEHPLK